MFPVCLTSTRHAKCTSGTDLLRQLYVLPSWEGYFKFAMSFSHITLTRWQPGLTLTRKALASGRQATQVPISKSLVRLDRGKRDSIPGSPALEEGFVGCLTSQQHSSASQGRICSDNFTRCHTETEVADQTFHLTQPQYTDTGPASPSPDPTTPGRLTAGVPVFKSLVWLHPEKPPAQAGLEPGIFRSRGGRPNH